LKETVLQATPLTLGDKLDPDTGETPHSQTHRRLSDQMFSLLNALLVLGIVGTVGVWVLMGEQADTIIMLEVLGALVVLWVIVFGRVRTAARPSWPTATHFLLDHDRTGFMRDLRLDAKTVIIDGSNLYHFGHDNGLDEQPLGLVATQMRDEGYRVVCFFDANIFYTLQGHGAFAEEERHSLKLLMDIFGLKAHEIYVVPSGVQADKYVLSSLRHLPISFAVTNDQFRDYRKEYGEVMKGDQWRKGVALKQNEIKLFKHRFKTPVFLT
jgi:hypothetical protein